MDTGDLAKLFATAKTRKTRVKDISITEAQIKEIGMLQGELKKFGGNGRSKSGAKKMAAFRRIFSKGLIQEIEEKFNPQFKKVKTRNTAAKTRAKTQDAKVMNKWRSRSLARRIVVRANGKKADRGNRIIDTGFFDERIYRLPKGVQERITKKLDRVLRKAAYKSKSVSDKQKNARAINKSFWHKSNPQLGGMTTSQWLKKNNKGVDSRTAEAKNNFIKAVQSVAALRRQNRGPGF